MTESTSLGIWMDHSVAHLISFDKEVKVIKTIQNDFDQDVMEEALKKGEFLMHNKRQQHQAAFYKLLLEEIILHTNVLLFGPTDAKTELLNLTKKDLRFVKIKIAAQPADKMTDNQKLAYVRSYFSN